MRKLSYFALSLALSVVSTACNDLEDNDYFKSSNVRNTNSEVLSTSKSVADYIRSNADLSKMSDLFEREGIYTEMPTSGELHTVLVVSNENYVEPEAEESKTVARSHVTNISVSPSKLNDGDRLLMWHNKYVTIHTDASDQVVEHITFNNSVLKEVVKAKDGFIYVISDMIVTPTSLQDFINGLEDARFSRFKDMVLSSGGKEFDRNNSKIVGVDSNGNTLYDSVFIYTNSFFDAKGFNLSNEGLSATMLYFSNEVIEQALSEAKAKYHAWGYDHKFAFLRNGNIDSVYVGYTSDKDLEDWILKAAFYNTRYNPEDLEPKEDDPTFEIKSIYDVKWRTAVQELDLGSAVELSNGIAYEVKKFRIPNNRLIYRLYEEFRYYEHCDADQKDLYFKCENLANFKVANLEVGEWTPLAGVWPLHGNSPLTCKVADNTVANYKMDFTPLYSRANNDGGFDVGALLVPPGTYRLAMGFKQNMSDLSVQLFCVDGEGTLVECGEKVDLPLSNGSTVYHYDRGNSLKNRLPEYYDMNDERNTAGSKNGYYWTDGGPVYSEIEIPDVKGDGSAVQLMIRLTGTNGTTATGILCFNHWCLRPTENNY